MILQQHEGLAPSHIFTVLLCNHSGTTVSLQQRESTRAVFEVLLQLETNLIFINLFVQDVVSVADLLGWFLGLLDLPPEFRDVLLKCTQRAAAQ